MVLDHVCEVHLRIVVAYAPRYAPGLAERVVELESHYGIPARASFMLHAPLCGERERLASVVVVAVDHDERAVYDIPCHEYGVRRSPGFLPSGIRAVSCGNLVELLGHERQFQGRAVGASHPSVLLLGRGLELLQEVFPDYVYDLSEAAVHGIVYRVVYDCLSAGAQGVHLLESAVTASHSGGED